MTSAMRGKRRASPRRNRSQSAPSRLGGAPPTTTTPATPPAAGEAAPKPDAAPPRRQPPAVNVLPRGTTPLVIDEAGRAQSPGALKFLEHRGKRETRAAKAIPPLPLSKAGPVVKAALNLHATRRTEVREKQQQLPDLLKAIQDRSAYLSDADSAEFRRLYDDRQQLLMTISGQARVTAAERETALSRFTAFEARARELQKKADDAKAESDSLRREIQDKQTQLTGLLNAVGKKGELLSSPEHAEFQRQHDECKNALAEAAGQTWVTAKVRDAALATFGALETEAAALQKMADDRQQLATGLAELTSLLKAVRDLGEDIDPTALDKFQQHHDASQKWLAAVKGRNPLLDRHLAAAIAELDRVRDQALLLQNQAEETRRNRTALADLLRRAKELTLDDLTFDATELRRLENDAVPAITKLQKEEKRPTTAQVTDMTTRMALLESREAESRGFLNDISPRTPGELEDESTPVTLVNSAMRSTWKSFVAAAGKRDRDMDLCRQRIAEIRAEIDRKTPVTDEDILKLINSARKGAPLKQIPPTLVGKAGNNRVVLKRCLEIEPRTAVLEKIFDLTDVPSRLPGLLESAKAIELKSDQVRAVLQKRAKSTGDAGTLFSKIRNTTKPATWFLSAEGGQTLDELIRILLHEKSQIWSGQTSPEPTYGPPAGPAVTFDHITNHAVPMVGASRPAPGGYAGNRTFGNGGVAPDMALPSRTATGGVVTYTEYDIRPYQPGVDRGPLRVVVGSDGRKYYTADHYRSFGLIT